MTKMRALGVAFLGVLLSVAVVRAQTRGDYREFKLGSPVARVLEQSHSAASDLTAVHARPALIQELRWRASFFVAGTNDPQKDSVEQISFSFVDNQLFKIAIDYDGGRTEGMTDGDMIAALSGQYGSTREQSVPATSPEAGSPVPFGSKTAVARWQDGDVVVVLSRNPFTAGFQLVVTSERLDALARVASAEAVRIEAAAAPGIELARRQQGADDRRAAKEKARAANKAAFRP